MRATGKFTTDGQEIFENDFIETKTKSKYPLVVCGPVRWDDENNKWLNLNLFEEGSNVEHTIFKITEKQYLDKFK